MPLKTAWKRKNVAHGPKNDYSHLSLRDTQWRVHEPGMFVLFRSTFVFQKIRKNCTRCRPLQIWRTNISAPSVNTRTSFLKSGKASSLFFFLCIRMDGIGKSFNPKTGLFPLNLNSHRVFKNQQYFMVSKSNFGAFVQNTFFLYGITPNHLRFKLWLVETFFFSRI